MIGDITAADEIYIVCGYTDMRKSIDGLCAIVEDKLTGSRCSYGSLMALSCSIKGCQQNREDIAGQETKMKYATLPGVSLTGSSQVSI